MSRTTMRRVERLEAAQPQHVGKWHRIIYREGEKPEPLQAALIASGEAKLEAAQPQHVGKWHRIIYREGENPEPLQAALIASGEAKADDNFMLIEIVRPKRMWE